MYEFVSCPDGHLSTVYGTDPQILDWIAAEVKKLYPLAKVTEMPSVTGVKWGLHFKNIKDSKGYYRETEAWFDIFTKLCHQGWEPLDQKNLRLKTSGI